MVLAEDKDNTRREGKSISPREGRGKEEGGRVVDQDSGPPNGEVSEVRGRAQVALLAVSSRGGHDESIGYEASALGGDTGSEALRNWAPVWVVARTPPPTPQGVGGNRARAGTRTPPNADRLGRTRRRGVQLQLGWLQIG